MAFTDVTPQPDIELLLATGEAESLGEGGEGRSPNDPGVDETELHSVIRMAIDDAVDYTEGELEGQRRLEQIYYDGENMPGDEDLDDTRSTIVSRDVHDTIKSILPSVLRTFFSGRSVVEYNPVGPEDEPWAKQATDYVNQVVLQKDNPGFSIFYDAFWDALTKGIGPVMWQWEKSYEVTGQAYSGLTMDQFEMLTSAPEVTQVDITGQYMEEILGTPMIDCHISYRKVTGGHVRLDAVPPEERLINKSARSIDSSTFYGRRRTLTVSEVVALGIDYDQAVELGGSENLDTNIEAVQRHDGISDVGSTATPDPSMKTLEYVDGYIRVDLDGDGFAELYHIACGGTTHELLRYAETGEEAIELVDDIPYTEFGPDPVPHKATGNSIARAVMDIQEKKTNLLRGTFDSLSRAIFPQTEVVERQVNMDDVLNPEIGAVTRVKQPGMIREILTTFMGKEALPVLAYMDEVKKNRTGINDATQGLDPSALQSTAAVGIDAAVSASQVQIELIARLFAQNGMARLFRGLLKLIKTHQDQIRTVKLRNQWVPVNPSVWNGEMDATVNTALGRGTDSERMAVLNAIADKQAMILEKMGPVNPLCTLVEYRHTLAEMAILAGYPNPDQFFLPVEHGQVIQQHMDKMQQMEQELGQAQQTTAQLEWELQKHTDAEDQAKRSKAFLDRASGVGKLVDAAQAAEAVEVGPNAVKDEARAVGPLLQ